MNSYLALKKHYQQEARKPDHYQPGGSPVRDDDTPTSKRTIYLVAMAFVAVFVSAVVFGIKTDCPNTAYYVYCSPK